MPSFETSKTLGIIGSIASIVSIFIYFADMKSSTGGNIENKGGNSVITNGANSPVKIGNEYSIVLGVRQSIKTFTGDAGARLNEFMSDKEASVIKLDLSLNKEQHEGMMAPEKLSGGRLQYVITSRESDEPFSGGAELLISVSDADDFFYDGRRTAMRLSGYFKVVSTAGPQAGYISFGLKPVSIEHTR